MNPLYVCSAVLCAVVGAWLIRVYDDRKAWSAYVYRQEGWRLREEARETLAAAEEIADSSAHALYGARVRDHLTRLKTERDAYKAELATAIARAERAESEVNREADWRADWHVFTETR